ncbi:MAG: ABC transporter ATP-binding protein [Zetaproteobacteria bacterium]|nr:MAG: ABC transporter ATP-binding protein [Zetaproteobacteria bacterium]
MNAIEVTALGKSFAGQWVVRDLSLSIRRGEIFAFLGPNGSGKTTTMRMLSGLLTPDAGQGVCLGLDLVRDRQALRERIGYVSQHFSLYEDLTVRENLDFVLRIHGKTRGDWEKSVQRFDLQPFVNRLAGQLSGGWKQRLALACALIHRPDVLLLDEPTSGIDPEARRFFWRVIQEEVSSGCTVMISTHYLDEVQQYCDRLAYLMQGRLLVMGTVDEIISASGLVAIQILRAGFEVAKKAEYQPGVEHVAQTTSGVLLTGRDLERLEVCAERIAQGLPAEAVAPRLEEVFLHLARSGERRRA